MQVIDRQRRYRVRKRRVAFFCSLLLEALAVPWEEVSVAFVGPRAMRALNRRYRGRDCATDVLSFAYGGPCDGEVVICPDVAWKQSRRWRTTPQQEIRRLLIHGVLHLLGYDHERDDGRMLRLQNRLLRRGFVRHAAPLLEPRPDS